MAEEGFGPPAGQPTLREIESASADSMRQLLGNLWKAFAPAKSRYDCGGKRTHSDFVAMLNEAVADLMEDKTG